jgi:FkbM family methyltransferase
MAQRLTPHLYFALREQRRVRAGSKGRRGPHHDMKAAYLDALVRLARGRVALDVGANKGWYCLELAKVASRVVAFEPNPELADRLRALMACSPYAVDVRCVALSDRAGTAELRVPAKRSGSATLEPGNLHVNELARTEAIAALTVRLERLDAMDVGPIGVMKIDVEGHQRPLLSGARQTLERDKPELLIEVDERHEPGSIAAVDAQLRELGYRGYFLLGPALLPMPLFRAELLHAADNWKSGKIRINDFFYFHESKLPFVEQRLAHLVFYPWP